MADAGATAILDDDETSVEAWANPDFDTSRR
jgi:hypothetical protein